MASFSIQRLAIAVTVLYVPARLPFLARIAEHFHELADSVLVFVVTNTELPAERDAIRQTMGKQDHRIVSPTLLGHPFLLPWCHHDVFRKVLATDPSVTHFMYLEDDIEVRRPNIDYWLRGREELRPHGLIPSMLRYEIRPGDGAKVAVDVTRVVSVSDMPQIRIKPDYLYMNMPNPYQGMVLLDRELMAEHLSGPSSNPDFGPWRIREKAAQGVTFWQVPDGFIARNAVGIRLRANAASVSNIGTTSATTTSIVNAGANQFEVDPDCLIYHTANNYSRNPERRAGKLPLGELLQPSSTPTSPPN